MLMFAIEYSKFKKYIESLITNSDDHILYILVVLITCLLKVLKL